MIREFDKDDYEVLQTILNMRVAGATEAQIIQGFINKYMDPECHICSHCGAAVRLGFERVRDWYGMHKGEIDNIVNPVKKPGRPKTK